MSLILGDSLLRNDKQLQEVLQDKASVSSDQSLSGVNTFTNEIKVGDGLSLKPSFSAPLSDNYNLGTSLTPFNTLFIKNINIDGKSLTDTIDGELEKLDDKFADYVTLATEQTVTGVKIMPEAKFPSETGSTDYRYPLTVPMATSTAKRYLLGSAGTGSNNRWTNLHTSVYMENGKLYSNDIEVVNVSDSQTLTNKILDGALNSQLSQKIAVCENTLGTFACTATLDGYTLQNNTEVYIQFKNGLSLQDLARLTLNINNTGAKHLTAPAAVYTNNSIASNEILKLLYIDDSYFILENITSKYTFLPSILRNGIITKSDAGTTEY